MIIFQKAFLGILHTQWLMFHQAGLRRMVLKPCFKGLLDDNPLRRILSLAGAIPLAIEDRLDKLIGQIFPDVDVNPRNFIRIWIFYLIGYGPRIFRYSWLSGLSEIVFLSRCAIVFLHICNIAPVI